MTLLQFYRQLCEKWPGKQVHEVEIAICHFLLSLDKTWQGKRSEIFSRGSEQLTDHFINQVEMAMERRLRGFPLQQILGSTIFLHHVYRVSPEVLIPRPETEVLVLQAIKILQQKISATRAQSILGLEIGLGSGIISIELLSQFPSLQMVATEVSEGARETAIQNAQQILQSECRRLQVLSVKHPLDVFEPLKASGPFDLIISNPPYLHPEDEIEEQVKKHEPAIALYPFNHQPLHFYKIIASEAHRWLKSDGTLLLEMPAERAQEIGKIFENAGWEFGLFPDLNGMLRVIQAQFSKS